VCKHSQTLVVLSSPTVPFSNAEKIPSEGTHPGSVGKLDITAVGFGPPANTEWSRRTVVKGTIDAPVVRNGERTNHVDFFVPHVVEHTTGNNVPIPAEPSLALVRVSNRF